MHIIERLVISLCLICFLSHFQALTAQKTSFNSNLGTNFSKEWKIRKSFRVSARQNFQINTETKKQDAKFGDIFNELDFVPIEQDRDMDSDDDGNPNFVDTDDDNDGISDSNDSQDDNNDSDGNGDGNGDGNDDGDGNGDGDGDGDGEDDDDEDDDGGFTSGVDDRNGGSKEIDLGNRDLLMEWRGSTSIQSEWRVNKWLRVSNGYALLYGGNTRRHRFISEARFLPKLFANKAWELSPRVAIQQVGNSDDGKMEWRHSAIPRIDLSYRMSKALAITTSVAINGAWDDRRLQFDRYRADAGVKLNLSQKTSIELGYRFQQRLGGRKAMGHSVGIDCDFEF